MTLEELERECKQSIRQLQALDRRSWIKCDDQKITSKQTSLTSDVRKAA